MQVWKLLASVLHLSNLEFDRMDHEQGDIAYISDREVRFLLLMPTYCRGMLKKKGNSLRSACFFPDIP